MAVMVCWPGDSDSKNKLAWPLASKVAGTPTGTVTYRMRTLYEGVDDALAGASKILSSQTTATTP
jgi:hypothetical protein